MSGCWDFRYKQENGIRGKLLRVAGGGRVRLLCDCGAVTGCLRTLLSVMLTVVTVVTDSNRVSADTVLCDANCSDCSDRQ
jgi:hypothetical protein